MQIKEGVHRLGSRYVNLYAVEDGGRLTIVDAGIPGYWSQVPAFLTANGSTMQDIAAIVLTHAHADHVGVAERLRTESGAPVLVHEMEAPVLRGDEKSQAPKGLARAVLRPGGLAISTHLWRNGGTKVTTVSEVAAYGDGDVLEIPGKPRIVPTPGHSPGHCCLLFEQHGVLFTGDALVTRDLGGRTGPRLMDINVDHEAARRALDRLDDIEAELILPGHGEPWRGGVKTAVEQARRA